VHKNVEEIVVLNCTALGGSREMKRG